MQNPIYGVLIENTYVPVCIEIFFEGFQFQAPLVRHVVYEDGPKIRQAGFGTNRCVFGDDNFYLVSLILIFPTFDFREWGINPGFGVLLGIASHRDKLAQTTTGQKRCALLFANFHFPFSIGKTADGKWEMAIGNWQITVHDAIA
jgi:hypothetical protein